MLRRIRPVLALALLIAANAVPAQDKGRVDPEAMAALQKMGTYLRTLKAFQISAVTTDEDVLESGQKIQYSGKTEILAQMPARLRAEVKNDRHERLYLYDGKTFTLVAERLNYYATTPAPATLAQLADKLSETFDTSIPLEDLFRWGGPKGVDTGLIKAAMKVGPSEVDGVTCEQYAFRQDDVDWQIWIQRGEFPLPRRLVITTNTDNAKPQHTASYSWNLAPSFNEAAFTFQPAPGAQRVVLQGEVGGTGAVKRSASAGK